MRCPVLERRASASGWNYRLTISRHVHLAPAQGAELYMQRADETVSTSSSTPMASKAISATCVVCQMSSGKHMLDTGQPRLRAPRGCR